MCGIFGLVLQNNADISLRDFKALVVKLYELSESRGKESAGIHLYLPKRGQAWTIKGEGTASELLRTKQFSLLVDEVLPSTFDGASGKPMEPIALLAHSRLVTNGSSMLHQNNQPVRVGSVTVIHNGIVVNDEALWQKRPKLKRLAEVDTEVIAAYLDDSLTEGNDPIAATKAVFTELKGAASIAWVGAGEDRLLLATNTGDLYYSYPSDGVFTFASERYILDKAISASLSSSQLNDSGVNWLQPRFGLTIGLDQSGVSTFSLQDETVNSPKPEKATSLNKNVVVFEDLSSPIRSFEPIISRAADYSLLRYSESYVQSLKRCSACVLPETFPFISFDANGVCSYCRGYRPRYRGKDILSEKERFVRSLERYKARSGKPDVLVPFSGGRDSSYGLHLIKNEFGFNPITFTYDWGMVTDLARRNIARMCGSLGIQNILVSADIKKKRENIRKNVSAWLRKPDLGMIPLFMAGDKHFFSIVNKLKMQTGIRLDLWSANPLENTDFKSGFCGVEPRFDKERLDYLTVLQKVRLAGYYGSRFIGNPAYLNSSLLDTAAAFFAYYFEPRKDFYFMFDHVIWNEDEVNKTLLDEYEWEIAEDTKSTWRIGDGTAPFYNYIYVTAKGFSEFDTFRSNQVREGMITREQALKSVFEENRPRAQSIKWYLDTIGLDFNAVVSRINQLDSQNHHLS